MKNVEVRAKKQGTASYLHAWSLKRFAPDTTATISNRELHQNSATRIVAIRTEPCVHDTSCSKNDDITVPPGLRKSPSFPNELCRVSHLGNASKSKVKTRILECVLAKCESVHMDCGAVLACRTIAIG